MSGARLIGHAVRKSRARLRLEQIRQHAAEGHGLVETAEAIGMTKGGVKSLLFRNFGSEVWPPSEPSATDGAGASSMATDGGRGA